MIVLYTGNGKGKTSASIGAIIRSVHYNRKVLFAQFFKEGSAEVEVLKKLNVNSLAFSTGKWITKQNKDEFVDVIKEGFEKVKEMHEKNQYDLIVLDELTYVSFFEVLPIDEVVRFINDLLKIKDCDIIITGRYADEKLIDLADLVTEMKEIKHPFSKGIPAKEGIDY